MLKPALLYEEELKRLFAAEIYTDKFFLYTGYAGAHRIPDIEASDDYYHYAIVDNDEKVVGFLSYYVDPVTDTVRSFGLYSFFEGNSIVGIETYREAKRLVNKHHRVEWKMISGNPVEKAYDKFCKKYGGQKVVLHDVVKDPDGNYRDEIIYEIVRK